MRTLLAIVASSLIVILAGMLGTDPGWFLALLGLVAVWLLRALGERERRAEHQVAGEAAIDQLLETVVAARQARPKDQDPHR